MLTNKDSKIEEGDIVRPTARIVDRWFNGVRFAASRGKDIHLFNGLIHYSHDNGYFSFPYITGYYQPSTADFIILSFPIGLLSYLNNLSLSNRARFDILSSITANNEKKSIYFVYPWINDPSLTLRSSINYDTLDYLFRLGYKPDPLRFASLTKKSIFLYAPLYFKYGGMPVTSEEISHSQQKDVIDNPLANEAYVTYKTTPLNEIVIDLIKYMIVENVDEKGKPLPYIDQGIILGLKIKHGLRVLIYDRKNDIIIVQRYYINSNNQSLVSFRLIDHKQAKKVISNGGKEAIGIRLYQFSEPLSSLIEIREMISQQQYHNYVTSRLLSNDYTVDLLDLPNYNIDQPVYPSGVINIVNEPICCAAFAGNSEAIYRLLNAGCSTLSLKDGRFAKALLDGLNPYLDIKVNYTVKDEDKERYQLIENNVS